MKYRQVEEQAEIFVTHLFLSVKEPQFPYHNLTHTKGVVNHAAEIGRFYALSEIDYCILLVAAWFHDTGHLDGGMEGHEERSLQVMQLFLLSLSADRSFIDDAGNCILVTRRDAAPKTLLEKIICDADTYHFGTSYFRNTEFLMKEEMERRKQKKFPQWHTGSLQLLRDHIFYTEYCQLMLGKGKQDNINWLLTLIHQ